MVPHVASAKSVEASIQAIIPDIRLFFNHRIKRWVVAQVKKNPGGMLLPNTVGMPEAERPYTLYVVHDPKTGGYREPSAFDIQLAVKIGQFGREAIAKGGDWLIDQLDKREQAGREATDKKLRDQVHDIAPDLKRALRKEMQ